MPLDPSEVIAEGLKAAAAGFTAFGAWVMGARRGRRQAELGEPGIATEFLRQQHSVEMLAKEVSQNKDSIASITRTLERIDERFDSSEKERAEDRSDIKTALELLREMRRGGFQ